ncbi:hypothetical protein [Phenylobacterium soli]|uniref:Uncharacterized protein n=1 Tax=Phenylobacterium soli TaxID=2170551 RepID=A0A328AJ40_9CAUL|nr:hypothetical protein [Phenylobacterium soli]RAK54455.1 hypothetical protein DJ017_07925 [Phenylobacterium soli]
MKTSFRSLAASAAVLLALAPTGPALAQAQVTAQAPQRFELPCYDTSGRPIEALVIDFAAGVGFPTPTGSAQFAQPIRGTALEIVIPVRTPQANYDLVLYRLQGALSRWTPSGEPVAGLGNCAMTEPFVWAWKNAVRRGRGESFP